MCNRIVLSMWTIKRALEGPGGILYLRGSSGSMQQIGLVHGKYTVPCSHRHLSAIDKSIPCAIEAVFSLLGKNLNAFKEFLTVISIQNASSKHFAFGFIPYPWLLQNHKALLH